VIKSEAVLPDGVVGSATITLVPKDKDQFLMRGTERIVGDGREDDFELTVTRAPPEVSPKHAGGAAAGASGGGQTRPAPATPAPLVPKR
jgi:hypothetical protein